MKKIDNILFNSSQFLISFSLFIGLGITKIINTAKSDAWICVIIGTLIGLIFNYIIKKINNYYKITVYLSNSILLLLGITIITKLVSSVYLNKTSNIIIIIPLLILILYSAFKERYSIMKVISILNIIYFFMILFSFASLFPTINIDYFKPVGINPPLNILLGSFEYALYSTIPFIALPSFKNNYNYKTYLISSLFILIIIILIIGNLGINLSMNYRYPEYMIFKNIAILNFIENTQNILFFTWIINIYTLITHTSLNIKEIANKKGLIITTILLAIIINLFIINSYKTPIIFLNYLDYIILSVIIIYFLGFILTKYKS